MATRATFIEAQARVAFNEAREAMKAAGRPLAEDRYEAARVYTGEAFDLLAETGFDPLTQGVVRARQACRAYAAWKVGAPGFEGQWGPLKRAWRVKAAKDNSAGLLARLDDDGAYTTVDDLADE